MRKVQTRPPSFPEVASNELLEPEPARVWQVVCGDAGHWRTGIYSPSASAREQLAQLERHDCPELFILLEGRLILVLGEHKQLRELELQPGRPVLVRAPHNGYCPEGPHTGRALVVERDAFDTEYREVSEW